MAYGIAYQIQFQTLSGQTGLVNLLNNGYSGSITQLIGAASPFKVSYKSGDYHANDPIRGSEADISYYNQGSCPLTTFDGSDDNAWRVDFYINGSLKWSGFLVLDDCRETMEAAPSLVTLKATDGLGLLKNVPFTDKLGNVIYWGSSSFGTMPLINVIDYCLFWTGLTLNTNIYANIFEENMDNRAVAATYGPFEQVFVDPRMYLINSSDAGLTKYAANPILLSDIVQNCYDILSQIMKDFNCTIFQDNGQWQIMRWVELKDFSNNPPGTVWDSAFSTAYAAPSITTKAIGKGESVYFLDNQQSKYYLRPNSYVNREFDYQQPQYLILNSDLLTLGAFKETSGALLGGIPYIYNDYYLPDWTEYGGDVSVIRVVLDGRTNIEVDRFILQTQNKATFVNGFGDTDLASIQLNPIYVSANSRMDFSLQYASVVAVTNMIFGVCINLQSADDPTQWYELALYTGSDLGSYFRWNGPYTDHEDGLIELSQSLSKWAADQNNYASFQLSSLPTIASSAVQYPFPVFPVDGTLQIRLRGFNNESEGQPSANCIMKDLSITITPYVNNSIKITGQYNKSSYDNNIRQYEIDTALYSDSPLFSVNGTMLLATAKKTANWTLNRNYPTDTILPLQTISGSTVTVIGIQCSTPTRNVYNISIVQGGSTIYTFNVPGGTTLLYFASLNLANITGAVTIVINSTSPYYLSFGFIQVIERMWLTDQSRLKVDCNLKGVGFGMSNVFTIDEISGSSFVLGQCEFDYEKETCRATLEEIWKTSDLFDINQFTNVFNYLYSS